MWTNSKWYWKKKRSNWKTNYEHYQWTKKAISERSSRNKARRKVLKWKKSTKEVDHKNSNPKDNSSKNLQLVSRKTNRVKWAKKANKKKWSWYKKNK